MEVRFWIAGDVFWDDAEIDEFFEIFVNFFKLVEFLVFHEENGRGLAGEMGPVVEQEMSFDGFMEWMRMMEGAESGDLNAKFIQACTLR